MPTIGVVTRPGVSSVGAKSFSSSSRPTWQRGRGVHQHHERDGGGNHMRAAFAATPASTPRPVRIHSAGDVLAWAR
jgi:predicted nucleic acid-binding Zn ribbon protein